ncbi:MAG: flavodoxin domain-containing protein [Gammaproteobacteria bacterium]|nr:flavodoxin domain-containing protein [Gammaproteobacteria bacterium]
MANILIISGSVYGTATLVAEDLQIALEKNGHSVTHQDGGNSKSLADEALDLALIVTSTTGAGDVPANLMTFHEELLSAPPRINDLKYAVIALGDSSYGETFCGAGRLIDEAMRDIGAVQVSEPLLLDALENSSPEDDAIEWVENLLQTLFA